jgi:spoIIIJ-associated protein
MSDISLDTQEPTALDFVRGLVETFGVDAEVTAHHDADDEALEIRVEGNDLGLLVGPRGNTLAALAELTRTAVAQQHAGRLEGRLRVDVAGYRARRKEALIRFAGQVADKVLETGEPVALEPMSPPDRKIVHDAVNDIDGVRTTSRGEDRRRHVVIQPDD